MSLMPEVTDACTFEEPDFGRCEAERTRCRKPCGFRSCREALIEEPHCTCHEPEVFYGFYAQYRGEALKRKKKYGTTGVRRLHQEGERCRTA